MGLTETKLTGRFFRAQRGKILGLQLLSNLALSNPKCWLEERISFDKSPETWFEKYEAEQFNIQDRLSSATSLLPQVTISKDFQLKISQICSELQVEGLRGDLVVTRAAKALAAFEQRTEVTLDDIRRTIVLCLRHRCRRDPMESINSGDKVETVFNEIFSASEI